MTFLNSKSLIKILTLNLYYEDRNKLNAFLIQVNIYVRAHKKLSSSHDKILFTFSYFKEDVFKWFKSLIKNHLKNKSEDQENEINRVFEDFSNFKQAIWRMYEDIDVKWIIEWQLYDIKQSESTFKYIATFQSITAKIKWDDSTLTAQFYKELKNVIKNEIARMNKFVTLHIMISKTIVLNNQQYKQIDWSSSRVFISTFWLAQVLDINVVTWLKYSISILWLDSISILSRVRTCWLDLTRQAIEYDVKRVKYRNFSGFSSLHYLFALPFW